MLGHWVDRIRDGIHKLVNIVSGIQISKTSIQNQKQKQDRAFRVHATPLNGIQVDVTVPFVGNLPALNLSISGLGLLQGAEKRWPIPGGVMKGQLSFGGRTFAFSARIIHLAHGIVGCAFVERDAEFVRHFIQWFDAELAAAQLTRMRPDLLQPEPDGQVAFRFGGGNELCLVLSQEEAQAQQKLVRFHAVVLGNYFEGQPGRPLRFGQPVQDAREQAGTSHKYKPTDLIRYSSTTPPEMVQCLRRFVEGVEDLDGKHRGAILDILNSA